MSVHTGLTVATSVSPNKRRVDPTPNRRRKVSVRYYSMMRRSKWCGAIYSAQGLLSMLPAPFKACAFPLRRCAGNPLNLPFHRSKIRPSIFGRVFKLSSFVSGVRSLVPKAMMTRSVNPQMKWSSTRIPENRRPSIR